MTTTTTSGAAGGDLLKPDEAAAELRVSRWTLDRLRKTQKIATTQVGAQFMYSRAAIQEYRDRNTIPAEGAGRTRRSRARSKGRAA